MTNVHAVETRSVWNAALSRVGSLDFYYTYDYHRICSSADNARPVLLVYDNGDDYAIFPLLVRDIPGTGEIDGSSVYGYCGPVGGSAAHSAEIAAEMLDAMRQRGLVSMFARLHPLIANDLLSHKLGDVVRIGTTVSIDLTQAEEQQRAAYRGNTRREIRKLRDMGVECRHDAALAHFEVFVEIYRATMVRVGAAENYFFDPEYFTQLLCSTDFDMRLYLCFMREKLVCGGLFSYYDGIVQYHLSGTNPDFYQLATTKLMLDTVRCEASEAGMKTMHLGGGLGGRQDSLFRFKAGFSPDRKVARMLRIVVEPERYASLCSASGRATDSEFFPPYRAPMSQP